MFRIIAVLTTLPLASCTYSPRNTNIENTYNARQMAIGVTNTPQESITSTTYEEEPVAVGDGNTSDSHTSEVQDLSENKTSYSNNDQEPACATPTFLTIGSTKSDVVRIQGTPTTIIKFDMISEECWFYGYSNITLKHGRVYQWDNDGNLKVKM